MVLSHKFYNGKVPHTQQASPFEYDLIEGIMQSHKAIEANIRQFKFREALFELMNMARMGNKYLADNEPWKTVKTDQARTDTIMYHALQVCAHLAWWMEPFMPFTAKRLEQQLNTQKSAFVKAQFEQLNPDHALGAPEHLFSNIEDEVIQLQIDQLMANKAAIEAVKLPAVEAEIEAPKSEIQFDDFGKMDIRIGQIIAAEKVKKADKLLQLEVDLGFETRTIVSGIALHFEPEHLIGKQVCVLVNLAPRAIKGIQSKGMVLMAEDANGQLKLLSPSDLVKPGSKVS
jgi:methionyl-tRNA synthetase